LAAELPLSAESRRSSIRGQPTEFGQS